MQRPYGAKENMVCTCENKRKVSLAEMGKGWSLKCLAIYLDFALKIMGSESDMLSLVFYNDYDS